MQIILKNPEQIEGIRKSSQIARQTLKYIRDFVVEGENTLRINNLIDSYIRDHNAIPATVDYRGYKHASCISLNDVICHGIPKEDTILKNGDLVKIDVSTILNSYFGDTCMVFVVGEPTPEAMDIMKAGKEALNIGIAECYPGNYLGNIGYKIGSFARKNNYSVVYQFCGHGVGVNFHEKPDVVYDAPKNSGFKLRPGMTFTIEPMINAGKPQAKVDKDKWTARTIDNKLSVQYEHTILITEKGVDVLTDIDNEYENGVPINPQSLFFKAGQ